MNVAMLNFSSDLILRLCGAEPQDELQALSLAASSFETPAAQAPQDEVREKTIDGS